MANRSDFSRTYVRDQLRQQDISFPAAGKLAPKELAFIKARTGCVLTYAGDQVLTGEQAECCANEYLDVKSDTSLGVRDMERDVEVVDGLLVAFVEQQGRDLLVDLYGGERPVCATVRYTFADSAEQEDDRGVFSHWATKDVPVSFTRDGEHVLISEHHRPTTRRLRRRPFTALSGRHVQVQCKSAPMG